ncbi:MAG: T9SS type A sorting domain-containing protein [Bacteroidales bacterium]|nr:T9SS type A sorting domain-containing protein [Bacteroidales bacterium]
MRKFFNFAIALLSMFVVAQSAKAVDFKVTVPEGTNACWVVGNFCGWDNNKHKLNKVDATHYELTVAEADFTDKTVTQATIKYKYLSGGGDWAYVEKDATGAEIPDRDWTAADVVAKWALVWVDQLPLPKFVTIDVLVPDSVKQVYIVGNFCNWALPTDSTMMDMISSTVDGKIFEKKIWTADAHKLQYKFVAGPAWDYQQTDANNFIFPATQDAVAEVVSAFNKIYDPSKIGTVTITATVPAGTDTCWIQGSVFGWNMDKAQKGVKNNDGTFTFVVKDVLSMEYRLYNRPDWSHPEVDDLGKERANRVANYPADATTAITVIGWKNLANGINPITADNALVTSKDNKVTVSGRFSEVSIFDLQGRVMESASNVSSFTSKVIKSGVYIVRVDNLTRKLVIK